MEAQDTSMSNSRLRLRRRGRDEAEEPRAVRRDHARRDHRCVHAEHLVGLPRRLADQPLKAFVQLVGGQPAPCRGARGSFAAGSRSTPTRCAPSALWFRRPRAWLLHSLGDLLDLAGVLRYFRNQLAATWPQSLPQRMRRGHAAPIIGVWHHRRLRSASRSSQSDWCKPPPSGRWLEVRGAERRWPANRTALLERRRPCLRQRHPVPSAVARHITDLETIVGRPVNRSTRV